MVKSIAPLLCLTLFAGACTPRHSERPKQPLTADASHLVSIPGGRFGVALAAREFAEITYVADTARRVCFVYTEEMYTESLATTASLIDCCLLVPALPESARAWGASLGCPAPAAAAASVTPPAAGH